MRRLGIALLFAGGCAPAGSMDRLPGQDAAEAIVWNQVFGRDDRPPPVEWIDAEGWDGIDGFTYLGWKIQVAKKKGVISTTAYAHELLHYSFWLDTGDVDPAHFRADWSRVAEAEAVLRQEGM